MTQTITLCELHESVSLLSERVDRTSGVIRGVKLVGLRSRNGRRYTEQALREATKLYEGTTVFLNHSKGGPGQPRDYQERIAGISNVAFRSGNGLFGDLSLNQKHPMAEAIMWDAENNTKGVGLSHNVLCETSRDDSGIVIESIEQVVSVDLVAGPATTNSLFEQQGDSTIQGDVAEHEDANWQPTRSARYLQLAGVSLAEREESNRYIQQAKSPAKRASTRYQEILAGPARDSFQFAGAIVESSAEPVDEAEPEMESRGHRSELLTVMEKIGFSRRGRERSVRNPYTSVAHGLSPFIGRASHVFEIDDNGDDDNQEATIARLRQDIEAEPNWSVDDKAVLFDALDTLAQQLAEEKAKALKNPMKHINAGVAENPPSQFNVD